MYQILFKDVMIFGGVIQEVTNFPHQKFRVFRVTRNRVAEQTDKNTLL